MFMAGTTRSVVDASAPSCSPSASLLCLVVADGAAVTASAASTTAASAAAASGVSAVTAVWLIYQAVPVPQSVRDHGDPGSCKLDTL